MLWQRSRLLLSGAKAHATAPITDVRAWPSEQLAARSNLDARRDQAHAPLGPGPFELRSSHNDSC